MNSTKKQTLFKTYGGSEKQTGSVESQVALFTHRIAEISKHLEINKKDNSTRRGLLTLVAKRKRLLAYLSKTDINRYRQLIEKLGIRK